MRGHGAAVDAPLTAGGRAWGRSDQKRCGQKRAAAGGRLLQRGPSSDGGTAQQHAGTRRRRWSVAAALVGALLSALLLVLLAAGATRRATPGAAAAGEAAAPLTGGGGSYLRQIAAVHDHQHQQQLQAVHGSGALPFDLQSTLRHCASQLVLPAVMLPHHILGPAWRPPPGSSRWPDDALQQLSLDCSSPAHAARCAEAAGSNVYEDSLPPLDPGDLALLLQGFTTAAAAASGGLPDAALQQLALDCERQPAACAAVADASNAYEEEPDAAGASSSSSRLAAAEAAAFFSSSEAASSSGSGWHALLGAHGLTDDQDLAAAHATNEYEDVQLLWAQRRQAEEAAAHYLDSSVLDLDCSAAAVQRDAHVRRECRRSRAVNRCEAGAADAGAAAAGVRDERTHEAAAGGAAVLPAQRSGSSSLSSSAAEARRRYFKNPCNSPLARRQFKNGSNHPMRRLHYKNEANIPASLAALLAPSALSPAPGAAPVTAPAAAAPSTGVWWPASVLVATAVAVLLCSACCSKLLGWSGLAAGKPQVHQQPVEQQLRTGSRSWSCLLVPWGSQELPATPKRTELGASPPTVGSLAGCSLAASCGALANGSSCRERPSVLPTAAGTPFALASGNLLPRGALADGRDVAALVGSLVLGQHQQQQQDVVQDGRDSPRPPMHGPFSPGATPVPHSRAGTPLPAASKGDW